MKLHYNLDNQAVWSLPFNRKCTNGLVIHGGVIATLIDNAGYFTVNQHWETLATTIEFHTRLLKASKHGDLKAVGTLLKLGASIAIARADVFNGQDLIATGTGTYALIKTKFPGEV
jgi:uncharacterized protein (TIGR00369 family)